MGKRLNDMLVLVSRVQERRGEIRFVVRRDPSIARQVHAYVDDLNWLSKHLLLYPNRQRMAAGKERLVATLNGSPRRRPLAGPIRFLGAAATATVLFGLALSGRAATEGIPTPVSDVFARVFDHRGARATPRITVDGSITSIDPNLAPVSGDTSSEPGSSSAN